MKLYEVKALAHETQSRIRQDLNAWNDFLEHASRVYRYRFMDQILIYAQRPDAVACATMNIWNSKMGCWIKKGNRGIALIDESNSRKLKYVWDVTSVVPKMGGHLPRLWVRKPYHTETIQNRLLKVYGLQPQTDKYDTKEPSIEHTMDYLVEYLADEYAADIAQEKYSSENSPLSELDEEKYKMDEYRRNVRIFFRYGLNRMIKERMGLSTGDFPDYDMSFIKDMSESDFCELSSRMTDAAQQALREVGIAVLTYDRVHGIDRDPSVDYNALKRKSTEREDKTYGTRIHQSRGLRDTEPYTEQGTTGAADEIRTYAQDMAQKELQGEVRYDADVRGTSGTLPKGTEESTGRDGQNRAADENKGRSDRTAEDAGPAEMDTNDEQHPEQGGRNSEGYSDLHFIENEIVPESGTGEDEYVPESGTGLYFIPELPTEDEQRIKVEKYGYLNPRKADYIPHDYIKQVMLRGTGFEGGFDRVVQIFQNEMEAGKRTALIKKEYGLGGASWPVDGMGLHGYDTYGSQGIRFQWRDEQGEAEGTLSWSSVEQEIGTLILTGEYKSRDRQNNDIIPEAEESDNISQTTEMQEQSTDKHKSEAPEQLSFTDLTNIEPDKTENTFDSYSWQLIENKQKFIGQIMTSKSPVRSCDDVDEAALSYAEVKALATGNPYIKEKMTLDTEVAKLKLLKANFKSQKYRLEDAINKEYPVRIAKLEEKIEGLRQDIITRGSEEILSDGFEIRINGVPYDDKKEGGAALIAAAKESKTPERTMIGEYKGFKLYSRFDAFFNLYYIHMQGRCEHTIEMSSDPAGMITRLNNCMAGFEKRLSDVQDALDETRIELETAEKEVTKKFDKEDILSEKLKRLSFLNAQLDADRKETPQNAPQNTQAQRNDIKEKYIKI